VQNDISRGVPESLPQLGNRLHHASFIIRGHHRYQCSVGNQLKSLLDEENTIAIDGQFHQWNPVERRCFESGLSNSSVFNSRDADCTRAHDAEQRKVAGLCASASEDDFSSFDAKHGSDSLTSIF
jgi:hypothetical protein